MKNADLPAMPTPYADLAQNGSRELYCTESGLTKREMFAIAAMQGICSNPNDRYTYEQLAGHAVKHADALLAELEKINEKQ